MDNRSNETQEEQASTMEDIIELAGIRGPWSWVLLILCSTATMISAFQGISYQFLGRTPEHWCYVEALNEANWTQEQILDLAIPVNTETGKHDFCQMYDYNYTLAANLGYDVSISKPGLVFFKRNASTISCPKRFFNSSEEQVTMVTQWDLVCENRPLYSTTQSVTQAGNFVGSLIFGYLMDKYGRRTISLICITLPIVLKLMALFSPNVIFFIVIRGIASVHIMGLYTANFIIALESCSPSQRSTVITLYPIQWTLGTMILPGIAYGVQHWKWLYTILIFPNCILLISFWVLPESPRWLLLHGRYKEALKVLKTAARINHQILPSDETVLVAMGNVAKKGRAEIDNKAELDLKSRIQNSFMSIIQVWSDAHYRRRLCFLLFGWFSSAIVYYGLSLSATNLSTNLYIYVFLGGLLEVPSYLLMWLWLNFKGRKSMMVTVFVVCGTCIALLSAIMFLYPDASVIGTTFLSLCGKFSITVASHLIWIYTAELFPTEYRSQAIAQGNLMGRIGSFTSPYINDLLGEVKPWAPSVTYATASLVAAGFTLLLPESRGRNLPEVSNRKKNEVTVVS